MHLTLGTLRTLQAVSYALSFSLDYRPGQAGWTDEPSPRPGAVLRDPTRSAWGRPSTRALSHAVGWLRV